MKRNSRKRVAIKHKWHNRVTAATPIGVADAFASSNFKGSDLDLARKTLSVFEKNPKAGKALFGKLMAVEFDGPVEYAKWAQFGAYFLKSSLKGDARIKRERALDSFRASEARCKITNRRLRFYSKYTDRENPIYRVILTRAKGLVSKVLGNLSDSLLDKIISLSQPGGGSCIGTRSRDYVALPFKLGNTDLCVTEDALPFARRLVESSPPWFRLCAEVDWSRLCYTVPYVITQANRIATVPKDAVTDRTIAVEPHLNVCLQLGVHEYVRRRLLGVGIDIQDQTRNQRLAAEGSAGWATLDPYVTLDLSAASDSVSTALCERLLPSEWLTFLDCLRSRQYTLEGAVRDYEKWSSMGNGYTFVLETLFFWALARACTSFTNPREGVSVYGDDIICRRGSAALLIEVLRYCGFRLNTDKSFVFGPFRESCGNDVFDGVPVTPVYIRFREKLRPTDVYRVLNRNSSWFNYAEVWAYLLYNHRLTGPVLYGLENEDDTSCLFISRQSAKERGVLKWNSHWQAWTFLSARFVASGKKVPSLWGLAANLLGSRSVSFGNSDTTVRSKGSWTLVRRTAGRKLGLGAKASGS